MSKSSINNIHSKVLALRKVADDLAGEIEKVMQVKEAPRQRRNIKATRMISMATNFEKYKRK